MLGCVAQQEGEEIFERAPWVSLVCGSASYSKLPDLLAQLEAGNRRVMGLDKDTDETFETEITRRDNPFRAYLTIIEGCDKACSYCVVPFTRGPERSRASAVRAGGSAPTGRCRLHRNSIARADGEFLSAIRRREAAELRGASGGRGRRAGNSPRAVYDLASARFWRATSSRRSTRCRSCAITCTCPCSRDRRAFCARCGAPTRARNTWKRSP